MVTPDAGDPGPDPGPGGQPSQDGAWPGRGLGLAASGPGSVAGPGRRVVALAVDWAAALLVSAAFFDRDPTATLVVFTAVQWLLVGTAGSSPGHRLLGLRAQRLDGRPPGPGPAAVRAVLIALVVPPLLPDGDRRGLHDRLAGTVLVRR